MTQSSPHEGLQASPWVQRWSGLVGAGARVLDVACGRGRHTRWFSARGCKVSAVDLDAQAMAGLRGIAEVLVADIENGPWPYAGREFDLVLVTNYLWRPLLPALLANVAEGGALIYETFAAGNETVGRPARLDFLLRPGELLDLVRGRLRVLGYEDGYLDTPPRFVQRIAAVRERSAGPAPQRYPL